MESTLAGVEPALARVLTVVSRIRDVSNECWLLAYFSRILAHLACVLTIQPGLESWCRGCVSILLAV